MLSINSLHPLLPPPSDPLAPQDLSNICWASAHMDGSPAAEALCEPLATRVLQLLPDMEPRQVATCLWGMWFQSGSRPQLQQQVARWAAGEG